MASVEPVGGTLSTRVGGHWLTALAVEATESDEVVHAEARRSAPGPLSCAKPGAAAEGLGPWVVGGEGRGRRGKGLPEVNCRNERLRN